MFEVLRRPTAGWPYQMTAARWMRQTATTGLPACRRVDAHLRRQVQPRRVYSTLSNNLFSFTPVIDRVYSELARVRDFIAPLPPTLGLRPAMAKIAV